MTIHSPEPEPQDGVGAYSLADKQPLAFAPDVDALRIKLKQMGFAIQDVMLETVNNDPLGLDRPVIQDF